MLTSAQVLIHLPRCLMTRVFMVCLFPVFHLVFICFTLNLTVSLKCSSFRWHIVTFFYCPPKPQQRQRRILNQLRHQARLHFLLFKSSMIIFAFASKRIDPSHAMGRCCGGGLNLPSCCCFLFIAPVFPLFLDLRAEPALRRVFHLPPLLVSCHTPLFYLSLGCCWAYDMRI